MENIIELFVVILESASMVEYYISQQDSQTKLQTSSIRKGGSEIILHRALLNIKTCAVHLMLIYLLFFRYEGVSVSVFQFDRLPLEIQSKADTLLFRNLFCSSR
jgi:hypothetical protein